MKLDGKIDRTGFLKKLLDRGVQTGNAYWPACNQQEVFKPYVSEFGCPIADEFLERHFSLPMYIELSDDDVVEICNIVKSCK